jgi:hypothetical protein
MLRKPISWHGCCSQPIAAAVLIVGLLLVENKKTAVNFDGKTFIQMFIKINKLPQKLLIRDKQTHDGLSYHKSRILMKYGGNKVLLFWKSKNSYRLSSRVILYNTDILYYIILYYSVTQQPMMCMNFIQVIVRAHILFGYIFHPYARLSPSHVCPFSQTTITTCNTP